MSGAHRLLHLPAHAIEEIAPFLPPNQRFRFATLHRLSLLQAESFRNSYALEFDVASRRNDTYLLDLLWRYCKANTLQPRCTGRAIAHPCVEGNIEVLRWWAAADKDFTELHLWRGLELASRAGNVAVLEWWMRESRIALEEQPKFAVDFASREGHAEVLQWWKDSLLPMEYSTLAIEFACQNGHVRSLQWWKDSGLELRYSPAALYSATENGHVAVLEWWKGSGWDMLFSPSRMVAMAESSANPDVLKWWMESGLITNT
ncbi:hypothetical protein DFJ73DRAFT_797000 [Zopfochytrium polystomum]|nr:hypothetical protein DFJ73DRAFT_797000 [Zopfochytrium polystomum]